MLADGGLGERCVLDDGIGDAGLVACEELDDPEANGVAERLEHLRQALLIEGENLRGMVTIYRNYTIYGKFVKVEAEG